MNNDSIIRQEIDLILKDIITLYNASGKRTSGEFEKGLEAIYSPNRAIIMGHYYLAGRTAGKQPPVANILQWIKTKGIQPISDKMTITGLAWAIAKKIAKSGTNKENHLKIYEQVITPERIDEVINKVTAFNVNLFVNELETSLAVLAKNI